jgi:hypothetical protein
MGIFQTVIDTASLLLYTLTTPMGSSPRTRFGSGSRQYGKRFPGCLDVKRKTIAFVAVVFLFSTVPHRKELLMSANAASVLRKYWKPALATGAGGTSLAIWFEEILLLGLDVLAVLALLVLAGPILLFNHFMFKSAIPRKEDR